MLNNCGKTPVIGDRIDCLGHIGTIKYIGKVENHPGVWFGVDWDDPTRGKHNGTLKGVHYFDTRFPTSGSFVRPEKVNLGQTALAALTSRYGSNDDVTAKFHEQQLLSVQQTINAPFLKLVGFDKIRDKQSDFYNLKVVNLRLQNVSTSGDPGSIRALCPNIIELDISKNLINDWITIFEICSQLDNLEWLNVSENNLKFPEEDMNEHCYGSLRVLICNSMKLTWGDVLKLGPVFPNLEELRLASNEIINLDTPEDHKFVNLKLLDLENNPIQSWDEILKLQVLKNLEQMNLENIKLDRISFKDQEKIAEFSHLKKLVLTNNLIDDWQSIGELNKLQKLEDLKFINNPILEKETFATGTELMIARIGNLKILNGTILQSDERRGAEYGYLKKYGLEYMSLKDYDQRKDFIKKHNRYDELITKHGMPEESEMKVPTKIIKGSLTELQIIFNERVVKKKLPPSMLVQKLITLVQRLFQLSDRPTLIYTSSMQSNIVINLDDDGKELGFYSMQDGDRILVQL